MREININDLPRYSRWPARLLGLDSWTPPKRDLHKIDQEYDQDKYAACLEYYHRLKKEGGRATPDEIKWFEYKKYGLDPDSEVCISMEKKLGLVSVREMQRFYNAWLVESLSELLGSARTVIELGSGYGYNLWVLAQKFPQKQYIGGDYSKRAVELGKGLFSKGPAITMYPFNLYERESYGFIAAVQAPAVVFTMHAIEQMSSSAAPFFDALSPHRDKIRAVVHFEPVSYELSEDPPTLLGLLRRRYIEMNSYNRDLLGEIQKRSQHIRQTTLQKNVLGRNPLNPTSLIQWKFA